RHPPPRGASWPSGEALPLGKSGSGDARDPGPGRSPAQRGRSAAESLDAGEHGAKFSGRGGGRAMMPGDDELDALLKRLHLASARRIWRQLVQRAEKEEWSYRDFLALLVAEEIAQRQQIGRASCRE